MAPSALSATSRYIAPEVTKIYLTPTVATFATGPTRIELDAGTDLTAEVAAATGWEISADRVAVPDLGTKFVGRISGRTNPGDAQIVFYASQDTVDVRDVLARGDTTNITILDGGDVTGQKGRCFAVQVSAVTPTVDVGGTEGARVMVDFSITAVNEEFTIPA